MRLSKPADGGVLLVGCRDAFAEPGAVRGGDERQLARPAIVLPHLGGIGAEEPRHAAAEGGEGRGHRGRRLAAAREHEQRLAQVAIQIGLPLHSSTFEGQREGVGQHVDRRAVRRHAIEPEHQQAERRLRSGERSQDDGLCPEPVGESLDRGRPDVERGFRQSRRRGDAVAAARVRCRQQERGHGGARALEREGVQGRHQARRPGRIGAPGPGREPQARGQPEEPPSRGGGIVSQRAQTLQPFRLCRLVARQAVQ